MRIENRSIPGPGGPAGPRKKVAGSLGSDSIVHSDLVSLSLNVGSTDTSARVLSLHSEVSRGRYHVPAEVISRDMVGFYLVSAA